MADVLSQSQIDALLNSMMNGDAADEPKEEKPEKNWKKYDFKSPKKFTKDKLKLLKGIYDNYGRLASSRLNGVLRTACEMEVLSVEEQRYFEFSNILSENDVMMMLNLKLPDESKNPPMMVHISQKLMVNMIDRMLGGTGDDDDVDSSYTYTEIESALYRKVMKYMLDITKDAWGNYIKINLGEQRLEENPGLFQEISLDEPVAIVLLNVKMQSIDGRITICIPGNLLMNIFNIIDKRKHIEGAYDERIDNSRELIMSRLNRSAMEIRAELGEAKLSMREVCGLKVGDVIDLNKPKESDIVLYVEEQPWFKGKLGAHNKNAAVKIKRCIQQEEAPVDE
ncbi:flagellar motor switch protein FliM [Lachnospiraceae bacterium]|uniref:flagellar motor switch protein FliM n=1 Tax=Extibacter sp. GGCC_0201 TaxID=2731209 RepID=UPI001AA0DE5C|nr:FliM/FliN family flagellar motor switch protein [Extibacter sp. GGCC_0201]MBO1719889.1 flagellar motor switch protein FliM [Extibacter sp. GGCC_0201]BDF35686.1 flagellar motor switch protein FliM [Lachnospiraceae bacterium]BDF39688.1 flagellar motor switch protein FliM [Lachnospiraceae bacterium]